MARVDGAEIENTSKAVPAREAALLPAPEPADRNAGPLLPADRNADAGLAVVAYEDASGEVETHRGKRFYPGRQFATLACSHETQGVPLRRMA